MLSKIYENSMIIINNNQKEIIELWTKRLCSERRKPKESISSESDARQFPLGHSEVRTEIERDFDRILFSTPVRRLADKTQVFPLDQNDSVRNRLTHSYEVSNLARSFGTALCYSDSSIFYGVENACRNIPSLLAAIGLVHDIGNPPFGHQGEVAIQRWFADKKGMFKESGIIGSSELDLYKDFQVFEGNAQGFRLVTKLQLLSDTFGLNLTYATLSAMMKYPTSSNKCGGETVATKKYGYFRSEEKIAEEVLSKVGLTPGQRHPFAYIMEACDDIAYVVLDAEDSVKKGLTSFADLMAYVHHHCNNDELAQYVVGESKKKHESDREKFQLSPAELNDISMQRFRVYAIGEMIRAATKSFEDNLDSLIKGQQERSLLEISKARKLRETLKSFSYSHGYTHQTVLALELEGFNTIRGLMDMLWFSIDNMAGKTSEDQKVQHPFARYVYTRISENYRRTFDASAKDNHFPLWYYKFQLLTDMVSGMTDSYALNFYRELKALQGDCKLERKNENL